MDDRAVIRRRIHWLYRALDKIAFPIDPEGCWIWTGALHVKGYPWISYNGGPVLLCRLAWEAAYGPIPVGYHVHHKCRTRACCRPDHLELLEASAHSKLHNPRKAAA